MVNLYFLNNENEEILVKEGAGSENDEILDLALKDLAERKPEFNSLYQRCWWDDHQRFWIDFGSYTEFYICHEPKDIAKECGEDFCSF